MLFYLIVIMIVVGLFLYYLIYIRPRLSPIYRARQLEKEHQLHDAVVEYKKAIEENPDDSAVHYRLAELYFATGQIDNSVSHLEKIVEIGKYNYEVDQLLVQKKLATSYYMRDEVQKAFQTYINILNNYPADIESLYHTAFISLGQEEFDIAQRYFDRLLKLKNDSYEIQFGAGICYYQNMRTQDAIESFKSACQLKPQSEIAQIAAAFACHRKRDYRQALGYITKTADSAPDGDVQYLAKRFQAFMLLRLKRHDEGIKIIQDILDTAKKNVMDDIEALALYDLGYALLKNEQTSSAYEAWNELYRKDRNYRNMHYLVTQLRREMDAERYSKDDAASVTDGITSWLDDAFPQEMLWEICGLKNSKKINLKDIIVTTRVSYDDVKSFSSADDIVEKYIALDNENFRIISNRIVSKMGFKVDQILYTYREADGVDFLGINPESKDKVLFWIRRWTKTNVGEITLRNFAQAINDMKVQQGIFITTAELTDPARESLKKLSKVTVVYPEQIEKLLKGLI